MDSIGTMIVGVDAGLISIRVVTAGGTFTMLCDARQARELSGILNMNADFVEWKTHVPRPCGTYNVVLPSVLRPRDEYDWFCDEVRKRRLERDMTMTDLAEAANVRPVNVSDIENKKDRFAGSITVMGPIGDVLGFTTDEVRSAWQARLNRPARPGND